MSAARIFQGPSFRALLKSYLLVGLVLIAAVVALFTLQITREVDRQSDSITKVLATLGAHNILSEKLELAKLGLLAEAIKEVEFPFVITDLQGRPRLWNAYKVGVPLPDRFEDLLAVDPAQPKDPNIRRILELCREFDEKHAPLLVTTPEGKTALGYLHYGESGLSQKLRWMPWIEALLITAFMSVALLAFRNVKRSEQRSIWVGMAKETAHQLGTPLTSLNGWITLLSEDHDFMDGDEGRHSGLNRGQVLTELKNDVDRLAKVSARFSKIGSTPRLEMGQADALLDQVCGYFQKRLPHLGKQVSLKTTLEKVPPIPMNPELLDWAVENLMKNALDAIDKKKGMVELSCRHLPDEKSVEILVSDNGKGMSPGVQRRVFDPGFSTKQRGWGMGLVLAHRIVVEYHKGHLMVFQSVEGEGTTMRILLPTA